MRSKKFRKCLENVVAWLLLWGILLSSVVGLVYLSRYLWTRALE